MSLRPALCASLAAILATQPACVAELQEHCPALTENRSAPALPRDISRLDDLLRHRALQMWHDARQLSGSASRSFRIYFAADTLPLLCARMEQARALAMAGRVEAAGKKYQALLVLSQIIELAIAVHATVDFADQVGELSLTLSRTQETFGNQMKPLLEAALSEDPTRIEHALRDGAPAIHAWLDYLQRWTAHIQADAKRMVGAKAAWDTIIGVIAAYETAGALAEALASSGPPVPPVPSLVGGAATMELSGATYVELAEAIRRLIATGALDAALVAALSAGSGGRGTFMVHGNEPPARPPAPEVEAGGTNKLLENARRPYNEGTLTQAGRALTKHPEVLGYTKDNLRLGLRTDAQLNDAAEQVLRKILNGKRVVLDLPRYGAVLEFRGADGFGARFYAETGEFIGFINP